MVTEEGVIEKIFHQKALVRIQKSSACAHCDSRGACQVISDKEMLVEIANELQAKVGDHVELSVLETSLLKLSLLVFFLPIVALVVGAYAGGALADFFDIESTISSVIGGALAMGFAFFALRRFDRNLTDLMKCACTTTQKKQKSYVQKKFFFHFRAPCFSNRIGYANNSSTG